MPPKFVPRKYICYGDTIVSPTDGNKHHISAHEVARLYGVNPKECVFCDARNRDRLRGIISDGLVQLWPRPDGNYILP